MCRNLWKNMWKISIHNIIHFLCSIWPSSCNKQQWLHKQMFLKCCACTHTFPHNPCWHSLFVLCDCKACWFHVKTVSSLKKSKYSTCASDEVREVKLLLVRGNCSKSTRLTEPVYCMQLSAEAACYLFRARCCWERIWKTNVMINNTILWLYILYKC